MNGKKRLVRAPQASSEEEIKESVSKNPSFVTNSLPDQDGEEVLQVADSTEVLDAATAELGSEEVPEGPVLDEDRVEALIENLMYGFPAAAKKIFDSFTAEQKALFKAENPDSYNKLFHVEEVEEEESEPEAEAEGTAIDPDILEIIDDSLANGDTESAREAFLKLSPAESAAYAKRYPGQLATLLGKDEESSEEADAEEAEVLDVDVDETLLENILYGHPDKAREIFAGLSTREQVAFKAFNPKEYATMMGLDYEDPEVDVEEVEEDPELLSPEKADLVLESLANGDSGAAWQVFDGFSAEEQAQFEKMHPRAYKELFSGD